MPPSRRSPQPVAETMRSIGVDGHQLRVAVRHGQRGRVPLLLINGIGASLDLVQPFVYALDPSLGVIRLHVPGVGGSPLPQAPYRFTGLCRLIARMLSELGHESADVVGICWGGGVAQHFAAFQRARCRRLVLVSTATGSLMIPASPAVLVKMLTPRRYLDRNYLQQVAAVLYGGTPPTDPQRGARAMHSHSPGGPTRGYVYPLPPPPPPTTPPSPPL